MSDFLVNLNPTARSVVKTLGLPVPLPQPLDRPTGPWTATPLEGRAVFAALGPGATLGGPLGATFAAAGADTWVHGTDAAADTFKVAYGTGVRDLNPEHPPEDVRAYALVYDATGLDSPEALRGLYDFFHPQIRGLKTCGRVVVLIRTPDAATAVRLRRAKRRTWYIIVGGRARMGSARR